MSFLLKGTEKMIFFFIKSFEFSISIIMRKCRRFEWVSQQDCHKIIKIFLSPVTKSFVKKKTIKINWLYFENLWSFVLISCKFSYFTEFRFLWVLFLSICFEFVRKEIAARLMFVIWCVVIEWRLHKSFFFIWDQASRRAFDKMINIMLCNAELLKIQRDSLLQAFWMLKISFRKFSLV